MSCPSCAHKNPAGSVFCQNCGFRLPAEPAPVAVAAPATIACNRCGAQQSAHMRFCTECGNSLPGLPAGPQPQPMPQPAPIMQPAPMPQPAPQARPQPAAQPPASIGQAVAEQISGAIGGPLCWRCRGVGDNGSEFCKFCGARYSDAPGHAPAPQAAAPQPAPYAAPQPAPVQAYAQPAPVMHAPQSAPFATAATVGPGVSPAASVGRLVSILKDGSDGQAFSLKEGNTDIGRTEGDIVLADDPYLSPRHARVRSGSGRFYVRDLDSANGVYIRLTAQVDLTSGDFILIGQQVRFEVLQDGELPLGPASISGVLAFGTPEVPRFARLVQYTTEGVGRDLHYLYRDETVMGRENGDIVFTDDPFLSRRHAAIEIERSSKRCRLKDVGSSNGTSLRVRGERELTHGDHFRVGRHLFRFDANSGAGR